MTKLNRLLGRLLYVGMFVLAFILLNQFSSALNVNATYYNYTDVLLVCNSASNESVEICDYFMQQRPDLRHRVNLTGLSGDSTQQYLQILNQINETINSTSETINYIVTTKGVPLSSCYRSYYGCYSVDSMLTYDLGSNKYNWAYTGKDEIFSSSKFGFYLVTRLDGYTVDDVKRLIDRSGPANRDPTYLDGTFVVDKHTMYWGHCGSSNTCFYNAKQYLNSTKTLNVNYNVLSSYYNQTNVSGLVGWGSYSPGWSTNVLLNQQFASWNDSQNYPDNWTVVSGNIYNKSFYSADGTSNATSAGVINESGIFEIRQNVSSVLNSDRRFYLATNYAVVNFSGNATIGIIGKDSSGNVIESYNSSLYYSASNSTSNLRNSAWYTNYLKLLRNVSTHEVETFLIVNLTSGEFYIDYLVLNKYDVSFSWKNGALATTAVSTSGRSFSNMSNYGQSLIADLVQDGATGVEGFVSEPFLSAVSYGSDLWDRYLKGYNLADSFYMASSLYANRNWKDVIIGDPKTIVVAPGLSTAVYLNNLSSDEFIRNGTTINLTISTGFNILEVNYTYTNGSDSYGPFNLSLGGNQVSIDTTNWSIGDYNLTLYIYDSLDQRDTKNFSFYIREVIGQKPAYSSFNGQTTDFKRVVDRTNTTVILERSGAAKINYRNRALNISGYDLDSNVILDNNNITIIAEEVPNLNVSAEIVFYDLRYYKTPLVYKDGEICTSGEICNITNYNVSNGDSTSGVLTVNVSGFSSYTTGVNANLALWDDSDLGVTTRANSSVKFYANYTKNLDGSAVTGASCSLDFSDSSVGAASYNSGSKLYEYSRTFSEVQSYSYGVNCTDGDYEPLYTNTTISISAPASVSSGSSSGSSGGSGGSGGSGASASNLRIFGNEYSWNLIDEGESIVVDLNDSIGLTGLSFKSTQKVHNAKMYFGDNNVVYFGEGKFYKGFNIRTKNISFNQVNVYFSVSKAWLEGNNVNYTGISLWKYDGIKWEKVNSNLLNVNGNRVNYWATLIGFSDFAIVGFEVEEKVLTNVEKENQKDEIKENKSYFLLLILILATGIIGILALITMRYIEKRGKGLSGVHGRHIYDLHGNHIGKVKDVYLENNRIYSIKAKLNRKAAKRFGKKHALIHMRDIKAISGVILLSVALLLE